VAPHGIAGPVFRVQSKNDRGESPARFTDP
jgi:hypothetical protein